MMSWSPAAMCSRLSSQFISLCPDTDLNGANVQSSLESQLHQVRSQELMHKVCQYVCLSLSVFIVIIC